MRKPLTLALLVSAALPSMFCEVSLAQSESVRDLVLQARSQAMRGNHAQAAQILDRARVQAPNSEDVLSDFAENSLAAADPVGAIQVLEPLTRMHPKVAKYPYQLGVALLQLKEFASSVESLRLALELEPDRARTLLALGITLLSQKEFSEAKKALDRSLDLEPDNAETLAVLAEAEEGLGDLERSERLAHRALSLAGSHAGAYFVLGRVRMGQGRYAEATDYFLKSVEMVPGSGRTHYQLSLAYARLGDLENSRKHQELHKTARAENEENIEQMRRRAGFKQSGMGPS